METATTAQSPPAVQGCDPADDQVPYAHPFDVCPSVVVTVQLQHDEHALSEPAFQNDRSGTTRMKASEGYRRWPHPKHQRHTLVRCGM
jgi:hypothetical protein